MNNFERRFYKALIWIANKLYYVLFVLGWWLFDGDFKDKIVVVVGVLAAFVFIFLFFQHKINKREKALAAMRREWEAEAEVAIAKEMEEVKGNALKKSLIAKRKRREWLEQNRLHIYNEEQKNISLINDAKWKIMGLLAPFGWILFYVFLFASPFLLLWFLFGDIDRLYITILYILPVLAILASVPSMLIDFWKNKCGRLLFYVSVAWFTLNLCMGVLLWLNIYELSLRDAFHLLLCAITREALTDDIVKWRCTCMVSALPILSIIASVVQFFSFHHLTCDNITTYTQLLKCIIRQFASSAKYVLMAAVDLPVLAFALIAHPVAGWLGKWVESLWLRIPMAVAGYLIDIVCALLVVGILNLIISGVFSWLIKRLRLGKEDTEDSVENALMFGYGMTLGFWGFVVIAIFVLGFLYFLFDNISLI